MKNLFWRYLRLRLGIFLFVFSVWAIFWGTLSLYNLSGEPLFYAFLLSGVLGLFCTGIDFFFFQQRQRRLIALQAEILYALPDFPPSHNCTEEAYQALVQLLVETRNKELADYTQKERDSSDYYSLWVHQIKTPIAAMRLLLQTQTHAHTQPLSAELFKIEQYVEMVLSYLRLDAGSTDYRIHRIPLAPLVRQAVRKYAPLFIQKKLKIDLGFLEVTVLTDEKWLLFVLEQLLSNAIKYTKKGTIRIYADPELHLYIADTGIGIAPEDLPRICEKGFTGYNGRQDKRASGIGLYLCRRIVGKLSHRLTFTSQVGKGTTAILSLASAPISQD